MIKNLLLIAGLVSASFTFAADNNSAVVSDKDAAVMVAMNKTTWSVIAANAPKGMTKVREFHDMGDSGVQQIDYVVNCANGTLALADFAVLTVKGRLPVRAVEPSMDNLSFYKPLIEHDLKVANNACESRMAMNGNRVSE